MSEAHSDIDDEPIVFSTAEIEIDAYDSCKSFMTEIRPMCDEQLMKSGSCYRFSLSTQNQANGLDNTLLSDYNAG